MRYTRQAVSHALRSIYSRLDGCRKLQLMQPLLCWFASFTHSAYLFRFLSRSLSTTLSCPPLPLLLSLSLCVPFFLSTTFYKSHFLPCSHLPFFGWCGLLAWKVCYKTALTSSWRICLSFRLNAVHRIQLRKIRQPAKRRKTKCAQNRKRAN